MTTTFSDSYREARERFRAAATAAGAELTSYRNDVARGPEAEELCADVAWLGPASAALHVEVGQGAAAAGVEALLAIGPLSQGYLEGANGIAATRWAASRRSRGE